MSVTLKNNYLYSTCIYTNSPNISISVVYMANLKHSYLTNNVSLLQELFQVHHM